MKIRYGFDSTAQVECENGAEEYSAPRNEGTKPTVSMVMEDGTDRAVQTNRRTLPNQSMRNTVSRELKRLPTVVKIIGLVGLGYALAKW